jgi:hypothetical protein
MNGRFILAMLEWPSNGGKTPEGHQVIESKRKKIIDFPFIANLARKMRQDFGAIFKIATKE